MIVHAFSKGINPKLKVLPRYEFEVVYKNIAVQ